MRHQSRKRMMAATALVVVVGCGGGSSTSPETFWQDLETAVFDFGADLDEVDADYLGRSWDPPDAPDERAELANRTRREIVDAYTDEWQDFVDRLAELEPPEGYPEAGDGYAEGLPGYFESAIVETERAALAATKTHVASWDDGGESGAESFRELREIEDTLEDEWELFAEAADDVGHPIDEAFGVRMDDQLGDDVYGETTTIPGAIGSVLDRAIDLAFAIEDEIRLPGG